MPTIEVSEEQRAYIHALREELADQVTYGHVRTQDALQYLIDHHREDGDLEVEIDSEIEPDGGTESADAGATAGGTDGGSSAATQGEAAEDTDGGSSAGDDGDDASTTTTDDATTIEGDLQGGSPSSETGAGSDAADTPTASADAGSDDSSGGGTRLPGGDNPMVNEMMSLLDQHDSKWSESDGSGGRYEVELPDGGTETVQTKDDVRAILFKHYR